MIMLNNLNSKIRICVHVTGNTLADFLENLKSVQKLSSFIELRVDYIKDLKISDIQKIREKTHCKSIFTCRKKSEGGKFSGKEEERTAIIKEAVKQKFDFVDLELATIEKMKLKKDQRVQIIVSYHNFQKTPSDSALRKLISRMQKVQADIFKIATYVNSIEDNRRLFSLLLEKKILGQYIIIGMGEKGKLTRILSPLLGGYLTFASLGGTVYAPGQVSLRKLNKFYQTLNKF